MNNDKYYIDLSVKSLDNHGRFAGYASVFNMVDSQRDIILRGAFTKSIKGRIHDIKLLWQHQQEEPIGVFDKIFEDARGLYVEGTLLLDVRRGSEAHTLLKAGAINGLSIGYTPVRYRIDSKTGIRSISEINLWEISLVTFPANEAANVSVVKGKPDRFPFTDSLAAHVVELRGFFDDDAFEQDTRGVYMTLAEKLERARAIKSLKRKSQGMLHDAALLRLKGTTIVHARAIERKFIENPHDPEVQKQILAAREFIQVLKHLRFKYNPDQPRVPAGNSDGGQWTSDGGGGDDSDDGDGLNLFDIFPSSVGDIGGSGSLLGQGVQIADSGQIATDAQVDGNDNGHILQNPAQYIGDFYPNQNGNTECVAFALQAGGAPLTRYWTPGGSISPQNPPPVGTWVATFEDGSYQGHVGAFYGYTDAGDLQLIDQFNSRGYVAMTTYHVKPAGYSGSISNDPSQYRILNWTASN